MGLLNKFRTIILGFLIAALLILVLIKINFISIEKGEIIENIIAFLIIWIIISVSIYFFTHFKIKKKTFYYLFLGGIIITAFIIFESLLIHQNNPNTITLIIVSFLTLLYVIAIIQIKKYRLFIIGTFIVSLLYFFRVRFSSENINDYRETIFFLFLIPIPIIIALWFFEQWKWIKTLKSEKGKAELALLKTQINPHFFFNTLNNLYGLTVEKSDKAPEIVLKLSDMMRYTIYEGQKDFVSLKNEIKYLKNYIELYKIRFQNKVEIIFIDKINTDYQIAPLLFIILLENAFKHGAELLIKNAYIHIEITLQNNNIVFFIENNFDENEKNKEVGIGLNNLKNRLNLIYPKKHILKIHEEEHIFKATLKIST